MKLTTSKSLKLALIAALALSAGAPSLLGQSSLRERSRTQGRESILGDLKQARAHIGPFYFLSRFELSDDFDLGLGDAFGVDLINPTLPTIGEPDYAVAVAIPSRFLFVPSKKYVMSADVKPIYRWYLRNKELRDWGYRVRGDTHFLLNHLYLNFNASGADIQGRDRLELNNLVDMTSYSYGTLGELAIGGRTFLDFSGNFRDVNYSRAANLPLEPGVFVLSRRESSGSAALRRKSFPNTSLTLGTEWIDYSFDQKGRDATRQDFYVAALRDRAITRTEVRLGYTTFNHDDPENENFAGLVGSVEWRTTPRRYMSLGLVAMRDIEFSTFRSNTHYTSDRLQITAVRPLGRRFTVDAAGQVALDGYPVEELKADGTLDKRADVVLFGSVGGLVNLTDHFGVGLGVAYFDRNSNFSEFSDNGIQLLLRLSLRP